MIKEESLAILQGIIQAAYRCITYTNYYELISRNECMENHFWIATQNALGDEACLNWAKIFGTYSEPTHYKNFFERQDIKNYGYSSTTVCTRLLSVAGFDKNNYTEFHDKVLTCRDKVIAHIEIDSVLEYSDLNICKKMTEEILCIFEELLRVMLPNDEYQQCIINVMANTDGLDFEDQNLQISMHIHRLNSFRNLSQKCLDHYEQRIPRRSD